MGKQIRRNKFKGVYRSSFLDPKQATEKNLLAFFKNNHYNLMKILHSPRLCQTLYRFFRARMSNKIKEETLEQLAEILLDFSVTNLKTADAIFCYLTVINRLAHQSKYFGSVIGYSLLKKKNETILHLLLNMPGYFTLEKDPLGKKGSQFVIKRLTNPDDSFHVTQKLIDEIKTKNPDWKLNLKD